jgi:succinate dehydrogenase hydrophobic membrane anchor protein
MKENTINSQSGGWVIRLLEKAPFLSDLVRSHGWHYVISWCHRISGVGIVVYLLFYINTLSTLRIPCFYDGMKLLFIPIAVLLVWLSCLPVVFHALNGGRLILYEFFGSRNDETMLRWTFSLTVLYAAVFGLLIFFKNDNVSPFLFWPLFLFWLLFILAALLMASIAGAKLWRSRHALYWKLQRITGVFLLVAIPAYLIFPDLNPGIAHEVQTLTLRMQNACIKIVDILLVFSALYHGGYGMFSIGADYIRKRSLRRLYAAAVAVLFAVFLFIALRLIISA